MVGLLLYDWSFTANFKYNIQKNIFCGVAYLVEFYAFTMTPMKMFDSDKRSSLFTPESECWHKSLVRSDSSLDSVETEVVCTGRNWKVFLKIDFEFEWMEEEQGTLKRAGWLTTIHLQRR
jgi:hypothetical protein